ncbi:MAG TPA: zinc ribbon domain-containing protein [Gemmata sp.]|nr:zinc ribbon domain-containing protein [Gemmata sp.]
MPTYDYECGACGHRFEELQSFTDSPLTKCPKCKKNKLTRLFGGGGAIIFKGGGFYETDYRRAGESNTENAEAGKSENKAETKAEGKTENKSETKSDAKAESPPSPPPPAASGNTSTGKSEGKGGKGGGKKAK